MVLYKVQMCDMWVKKHYLKIIRTIFITGGAFTVNYLITFFLAPYIIRNVGTDAYGFVSLAKNTASYASYVTIALNSYAARFISVEYHRGNIHQANIFFSSTFWGNLAVGSWIMLAAAAGILFLDKIFHIPESLVFDVKVLFLFIFIKFWITTVMSVYSTGAYAADKLDITGVCKGVSFLLEAAVLLIVFHLFKARVFFVGIGVVTAASVVAASDYLICKRFAGELKVRKKDYRFDAVKTLVANGIWSSVSSLGQVLNSGLDLVVCNLLLTPFAMGQLAVTDSVNVIFLNIYVMISEAFKPGFLKLYADNDINELVKEMKRSMKLTGLSTNLVFAGFFTLGMVYYRLWIPGQDISLIFRLTMIVLGSGMLIGLEYPLFYIYTLTLTRKISCLFTLSAGALNVISMYVAIKYFNCGIYAVVVTTLVLQSIIHLIPHPLYMAHALKLSPWTFYPDIIKSLSSCAVMCFVFRLINRVYMPSSWVTLALCVPVYVFTGSVIHLLMTCSRDELESIRRKLRKNKCICR